MSVTQQIALLYKCARFALGWARQARAAHDAAEAAGRYPIRGIEAERLSRVASYRRQIAALRSNLVDEALDVALGGKLHARDEHCTVGDDGCCTDCGVSHAGGPCASCGRHGFHAEDCNENDERAYAFDYAHVEAYLAHLRTRTSWQGGYWFDGNQRDFADEAAAVAWAKAALSGAPADRSLDVGENVRQVGGGAYARNKKVVRVFADGRTESFFVSAVCG